MGATEDQIAQYQAEMDRLYAQQLANSDEFANFLANKIKALKEIAGTSTGSVGGGTTNLNTTTAPLSRLGALTLTIDTSDVKSLPSIPDKATRMTIQFRAWTAATRLDAERVPVAQEIARCRVDGKDPTAVDYFEIYQETLQYDTADDIRGMRIRKRDNVPILDCRIVYYG